MQNRCAVCRTSIKANYRLRKIVQDQTPTLSRPALDDDLNLWLDYISSVHWQSWDLGLDRMHLMVQRMQLSRPAPCVITVAGTNGKGSTCKALEAGLLAAGKRVALTTSPHIVRFNERFRINGQDVDDAVIVEALNAVDIARESQSLSYFEFSALAFLLVAAQAKVDVAVLEIGLGGRLDAFNAIDPDVAVITSIGFDHEKFLGNTLDEIGSEKAGILRHSQHVVLGPHLPESVFKRCDELNLTPSVYGRHFVAEEIGADGWVWQELDTTTSTTATSTTATSTAATNSTTPITIRSTGNVAAQNIAVAAAALRPLLVDTPEAAIDLDALLNAMSQARLTGRFDQQRWRERTWLLDIAHNIEGAQFLLKRLEQHGVTVKGVMCAMLQDKHHKQFIQTIAQAIPSEHAIPWIMLDSQGERGLSGQSLVEIGLQLGLRADYEPNMTAALEKVMSLTQPQDVILCLGSFSLVEQFYLHVSP